MIHELVMLGPSSERLSDEQLELLEQEPGVSQPELEAESQLAQLELPLKRAKQLPTRQTLSVELPRKGEIIACAPQDCICGNCGREKVLIGYETAEQLDVEPTSRLMRRRWTCKDGKSKVKIAKPA